MLVCIAVFDVQSMSMVSLKNAVISSGLVSSISGIIVDNGQPFWSVTSIGYVPSDKPVKHQFPPPLSTHPDPKGNGLVPPIIVIQIDPFSKAGGKLQFRFVISTLVTSSIWGSLITLTTGLVSQPLASSIL